MVVDFKICYLSVIKVVYRFMGIRKYLVFKDLDIRFVKDSELVYL